MWNRNNNLLLCFTILYVSVYLIIETLPCLPEFQDFFEIIQHLTSRLLYVALDIKFLIVLS